MSAEADSLLDRSSEGRLQPTHHVELRSNYLAALCAAR